MSVVINMDAADFEQLLKMTSTRPTMTIDPGRFQTAGGTEMNMDWGWSVIHWLGRDYTPVILARAFLESRSRLYKVAWDTAGEVPGGRGWCIFTNRYPPSIAGLST